MANIGFTTGSLYFSQIPLKNIVKMYYSLGADAIELSFSTPNALLEYKFDKEIIKDIQKFETISIHAPWKEIRYDSGDDTDKIIKKLKRIYDKLPIKGIVLHPDRVDGFERLEKTGLPFLIENMDQRKEYGISPEQFKIFKKDYNFGFVLDLQHSYEHDPTMKTAKKLIKIMGDRLKHIHVSGCNQFERHAPTYLADNKKSISKILKMGINTPKILEGILSENIKETIKNELRYIRNYEKNI